MSHLSHNPDAKNPLFPSRKVRRYKVELTERQLRLLWTEMETNAACCDTASLARDYRTLEQKFRKTLNP